MKLATLRRGGRDGTLVVVHRDGLVFTAAADIAPTLQAALDDWDRVAPALAERASALEAGRAPGEAPLDLADLGSPLPRAFEWIDGSAYLSHVILVRRARGAEPPPSLATDPLVYQGGSGVLLAPTDPIPLGDVAWGLDFEAEVAVVLGDTPVGTRAAEAHRFVRLVMLANDVTYRNLVPAELAKGFGFFGSKPATAFSPFAVTPDELGPAWRDGRLHLPLRTRWNGAVVGEIDAGAEMHFSFFDLVAHVTRTRAFTAGTVIGGGTVSTADPARGVSCLAERRARETIDTGAAQTRYLEAGDTVEIEVPGAGSAGAAAGGAALGPFGIIRQTVVPAAGEKT
jgi:fumarylacetoacetate (FAA) hydrolase